MTFPPELNYKKNSKKKEKEKNIISTPNNVMRIEVHFSRLAVRPHLISRDKSIQIYYAFWANLCQKKIFNLKKKKQKKSCRTTINL
jgi:hypothetical protein